MALFSGSFFFSVQVKSRVTDVRYFCQKQGQGWTVLEAHSHAKLSWVRPELEIIFNLILI